MPDFSWCIIIYPCSRWSHADFCRESSKIIQILKKYNSKKDLTCLNCLKAPLIFNVSAAIEANSSLLEILEYRLGVSCADTPQPPDGTVNCWQHIVQLVGLKPDQLVHLVQLICSFWSLVVVLLNEGVPLSGWDRCLIIVISCPVEFGPVWVIMGMGCVTPRFCEWMVEPGGKSWATFVAEVDPLLNARVHGGCTRWRANGDGESDLICKGSGYFSEWYKDSWKIYYCWNYYTSYYYITKGPS